MYRNLTLRDSVWFCFGCFSVGNIVHLERGFTLHWSYSSFTPRVFETYRPPE